MNREKIKGIEQMTWDALHKLAAKAAETEKRKREITYTFLDHMPQLSREHLVLIVCLATPYESSFVKKYLIRLLLFQIQFGKKKELRAAVYGTKLNVSCTCEGAWYMPNDRTLLVIDELRQYFEIEPEKQINMVISLGFPKDKPKKLPRKEVE